MQADNSLNYEFDWHGITVSVRHTPNWMNIADHIEVRSGGKVPLPITSTGYKSHFLHAEQLEDFRDAGEYVRAWLDHEAASSEWRRHEEETTQLSLF